MSRPCLLAVALLVSLLAGTAQADGRRNELGLSVSTGLRDRDPDSFGAIGYQYSFDLGPFVGASLGRGYVVRGRDALWMTVRAGWRFVIPGWPSFLRPQVSVEHGGAAMMSFEDGRGTYLNLGVGGPLGDRFFVGLEAQYGKAMHTGTNEPQRRQRVHLLRASAGLRF